MTTEWRQGQNQCGGEKRRRGLCILTFSFFLLQKLRVWTRRRVERLKPKIYLRRRKRSTQWQKNDNHTKISNTKNNGEKSFIQRTCKYWSYPGPGLVSLQITSLIPPCSISSSNDCCICECCAVSHQWLNLPLVRRASTFLFDVFVITTLSYYLLAVFEAPFSIYCSRSRSL